MKKLLALLLASLLCLGATALADAYQVILDQGTDAYEEEGLTLAVLDAEFPQIIGLADTAVMDRVNHAVQDYIRLEGGYDGVCEAALGDYQNKSEWMYFTQGHYDLTVRASSPFHSDRLFAVLYEFSAYVGGAHGDHWAEAAHYDVRSGDPVLLESLVTDIDAFHTQVAELLIRHIDESGMAKSQDFFEGYEETVRAWFLEQAVLAEDGLLVFFNQYDVAPYSSGAQYITIPYEALDTCWNDLGRALLNR